MLCTYDYPSQKLMRRHQLYVCAKALSAAAEEQNRFNGVRKAGKLIQLRYTVDRACENTRCTRVKERAGGFPKHKRHLCSSATLALCVGMCLCMKACLPVCVHAEARGPCRVSSPPRLHRFRQDLSPVLELAGLTRLAGE